MSYHDLPSSKNLQLSCVKCDQLRFQLLEFLGFISAIEHGPQPMTEKSSGTGPSLPLSGPSDEWDRPQISWGGWKRPSGLHGSAQSSFLSFPLHRWPSPKHLSPSISPSQNLLSGEPNKWQRMRCKQSMQLKSRVTKEVVLGPRVLNGNEVWMYVVLEAGEQAGEIRLENVGPSYTAITSKLYTQFYWSVDSGVGKW